MNVDPTFWINVLVRYIPRNEYLIWATVSKAFREMLLRINYPKVTSFAAMRGNLELIQLALLADYQDVGARKLYYEVAKTGDAELMGRLIEMKKILPDAMILPAVMQGGHIELYRFLKEKYNIKTEGFVSHFITLARHGHVEMFKELSVEYVSSGYDVELCLELMKLGNIELLNWKIDNMGCFCENHHRNCTCCPIKRFIKMRDQKLPTLRLSLKCGVKLVDVIATTNNFELWEYIISAYQLPASGSIFIRRAKVIVIENDNIEFFERLHNLESNLDFSIFTFAVSSGAINIVRWFAARYTYTGFLGFIIKKNVFELLQISWGMILTREVPQKRVVFWGCITSAQWLHARRAIVGAYYITFYSLLEDNVEIIDFLHRNGYQMNVRLAYDVFHHFTEDFNNFAMIKWMFQVFPQKMRRYINDKIIIDNIDLIKYLQTVQRISLEILAHATCSSDNFEVLQWRLQHGLPLEMISYYKAISANKFCLARWIKRNSSFESY